MTKLKIFSSSHGLERITDFTTQLPDLTLIFHFHDNDPTISKYQLNAYNSESKGRCPGLSMRSINNSPLLPFLFGRHSWRLTQQPHHSPLPHSPFTRTLPPSRQNLPCNMETENARYMLSQPPLCLQHQPWPLWPEGKSAETGVRNRGNRAKEHGSSLWLKGFWEKLPPFNFLRYNCLKKMLRD